MSTRYAGKSIRRGAIAADRFTQVSNALFRDPRISFKAKGLFGLLSTHRDGYGVTAASIARQAKEGVGAIESGLRELERFGYLVRDRERRPDGTLGAVEYFITDAPVEVQTNEEPPQEVQTKGETRRSEPNRENPGLDNPGLDQPGLEDRGTKNTNNNKKTNKQKTPPSVRPLSGAGDARASALEEGTDGRTDGIEHSHNSQTDRGEAPARPVSPRVGGDGTSKDAGYKPTTPRPRPAEPVPDTPGVRLLQAAAREHPEDSRWLQLTGPTLADQGAKVDHLLSRGFPEAQIRAAAIGQPLPDVILKSVGGIVSRRLDDLGNGRPHVPGPAPADEDGPARPTLPPPCDDHARLAVDYPEGIVPASMRVCERIAENGNVESYRCPRCHPRSLTSAAF